MATAVHHGAEAPTKDAALEASKPGGAVDNASGGGGGDGQQAAAFECNICLEIASDPVITLCGHLYCWPCIYGWIQMDNVCKQCPVCKAGVDEDKVIPLYGRGGGGGEDPRKKKDNVPNRPAGQRPPATATHRLMGEHERNLGVSAGFGFLPALFGLQFGLQFANGNGAGGNVMMEPVTSEHQHQVYLSRLLLLMGSFVIMCLLFF